MQPLDLLRVQRDRGVSSAERDLGMMPFGLGKCGCTLDEGERLVEIPKTLGPLDSLRCIQQLPVPYL
jgi:hypothetical protein